MKKKSFLRDLLEIAISVAVISFILIKFIIMPCQVHGSSMYPTLKDKERAYSFVITKSFGIDRFDICVVEPDLPDEEKLLVKRVIGLPNETVSYKNNQLFINGEYIEETFLGDDVDTEDFNYQLGKDEYFCLGDNREVSKDSRYYGPFTSKQILATNIFVIFPFSEFGVRK